MTDFRPLRVFLCHASQDKPVVRKLYSQLKSESWIDPWLDEEKLLPGQDFDLEIYKAIREADVILICLSKESIAKEGYVQKEFKRAFNFAEEKPEGTIYIIPLRLDECEPPLRFKQWQWVDYFNTSAHEKLIRSLRLRASDLKITIPEISKPEESAKADPTPVKYTPGGRPVYVFGGMDFVKVAAGDFYMGTDDIEDAKPQHLVYQLNYDFYMARFPVTNLQYSMYLRELSQPVIFKKEKSDHPVVEVSWGDAQNYIKWMNQKHENELPNGYCFRLPSEAEWERSARGVAGNEYPWGNTFDKNKCNTWESGINGTTPVSKYSPQGDSPEGCADMAGNVLEWTRSLYGFKYPYIPDDGREDENVDDARYLRGGSWSSDEGSARVAIRDVSYPNGRDSFIGFRVVALPSG
jgi:formylglycine-generating enzyme required for sulfatase activity